MRYLRSLQLLDQLRHGLEQVSDKTIIGHLEDRRLFVLVDRNDDLGVFHACQVLDCTGDANRNIKLWCDDLTGLTHLPVVRRVT